MLTLTRRPGEAIKIGDVLIVLDEIRSSGSVRISIDAPIETPIARTEILDAAEQAEIQDRLIRRRTRRAAG